LFSAAVDEQLGSSDEAALVTTPGEAAHAVVAAYDGVTVQLLLDHDLTAARGWLHQLLTALLDPSRGHSTDGPSP
jgi:hypothetical protein